MHKLNERYDKRIEKLERVLLQYKPNVSRCCGLKLDFSLNEVGNEIIDLRQLERFFSNFQKSLAAEYWYQHKPFTTLSGGAG